MTSFRKLWPLRCVPWVLGVLLLTAIPDAQARNRTFCDNVVYPSSAVTVSCGGEWEPNCASGAACDPGYSTFPLPPLNTVYVWCNTIFIPDEEFDTCHSCGGDGELGCVEIEIFPLPSIDYVCDAGQIRATTESLNGSISACSSFIPPVDVSAIDDASGHVFEDSGLNNPLTGSEVAAAVPGFVNTLGICSTGDLINLSGASREDWSSAEEPAQGPGTVIAIHGRGSECGSKVLPQIYPHNQLTYCVEYDQKKPGAGREVRILRVQQDGIALSETNEGPASCSGSCVYDVDDPVAVVEASALSVEGIAAAVAQALESVPTQGEITLIPHSQGGFVARALLHRHYDDLRWKGKRISRVVSLGHPYYGLPVNPYVAAPWACVDDTSFSTCAVSRWLSGWHNLLLGSAPIFGNPLRPIDGRDFPQIRWSAIAGDSTLGDTSDVSAFGSAACAQIFGGVASGSVAGDGTVPIQSSLGYSEHGFYYVDSLLFDDRLEAPGCGHGSGCMMTQALALLGEDLVPSAAARHDGVLVFDGDDELIVSDPTALAALTLTTALTLEAWIRPAGERGVILNKSGEYVLDMDANGYVRWSLGGFAGSDNFNVNHQFPKDRWGHIALTYDSTTGEVRAYADGELVQIEGGGGVLADADPAANQLRIGGTEVAGPLALVPIVGMIDEVRVWSRALTAEEIGAVRPGAGNAAGLVGRWSFDEASGDAVLDSSGNGFDLAVLGGANQPRRWGSPREALDGALYFDGFNDRAVVDDPAVLASLEMTNALTLEAWIAPRSPGGPILYKEGEYGLTTVSDGRIAWAIATADAPGWFTVVSTATPPLGEWTHVALSWDGSQTQLYINGSPSGAPQARTGAIVDFHATSDELHIGNRQNPGTSSFHGAIDEVRVWNRARGALEIQTSYRSVLDASTETGLVAYWRFSELDGTRVLDSALGNHARLGDLATSDIPAIGRALALPGFGLDSDADGLLDAGEYADATNAEDPDTDGDGLCDGSLVLAGVCHGAEDTNANGQYDVGSETDPKLTDTDGDGFSDGDEVAAGSDALDPASIPGGAAAVPGLGGIGLWILASTLLGVGLVRSRRR